VTIALAASPYPDVAMTRPVADRSPLLPGALALAGDGTTAHELAARFEGAGAAVSETRCRALLEELAHLGLARVASGAGAGRRYVPTSLGRQLERASIAASDALRDELAALERLRSDLLSTIAHEIRTPLTAIRTSVGLLLEPTAAPTPDEHRMLLATIERNADRMQRIVADLLDLTRFRSGRVSLQLRRFDATAMARAAVESIAPLAEAAEQQIDLLAPVTPLPVFGDHRRLEQALVNLVSNAQKYSPRGARIRVSVDAAHHEIRWTVADEGPGIETADQERLFERFFVGRSDRGGRAGGAGLGLPITLAIAQAHGGRVDVESVVGTGSVFRLVVPAAGPHQDDAG